MPLAGPSSAPAIASGPSHAVTTRARIVGDGAARPRVRPGSDSRCGTTSSGTRVGAAATRGPKQKSCGWPNVRTSPGTAPARVRRPTRCGGRAASHVRACPCRRRGRRARTGCAGRRDRSARCRATGAASMSAPSVAQHAGRRSPQRERPQVDAVVRRGVVLEERTVRVEVVVRLPGERLADRRTPGPRVEPGLHQRDVGVRRRDAVVRLAGDAVGRSTRADRRRARPGARRRVRRR